jgi:hypothetical protein
MTQLSPAGGAMPSPSPLRRPASVGRPRPPQPHPFNGRALLTLQIASRRIRLAELEAEMLAACERALLDARPRRSASLDRKRWGRAAWHRYLAAAMRLEAAYGPRICRLRQEIAQLERLTTLLPATRDPA